jgi:lipopolysaccharide export system permease protein
MLPVANLKMGSLLWDVRNQKAAFLINEGVFNNSIPGYSIRVDRKDPDGQTLYGVVIYDRVNNSGNVNVVVAESGKMFRTADDSYLILKLKNGIRYEETPSEKEYNPRLRFTRFGFKETEQKFDLSGFKMQRTDENLFKSNYAMLNMKQLSYYKDSVTRKADTNALNTLAILKTKYKVLNPGAMNISSLKVAGILNVDKLPKIERARAAVMASENIRTIREMLSTKVQVDADFNDKLRNFIVEYNRKITLAVSCLVLFFIGAPLGAIIRKGGLGLPVVVSVIFFLVYHIISTIGEKYAKEGDISPILGMWVAIIVLSPVGAFLTYKASVDSVLFDVDLYKQWFKNLFKKS